MAQDSALVFRLEANINQMMGALSKAQSEVERVSRAIDADFGKANASVSKGISTAAKSVETSAKNMQSSVGNIAAQFNDIGVTAVGGMSPMLIALQQGTQLSQAFAGQKTGDVVKNLGAAFSAMISPVSLVTIGLVAAAAAAAQWVVSAFQSSDGAEDAAKQLEDLRKQIEAYTEAMKVATMSNTDLFKNFGNASPELKSALTDLANIEKIKAYETLDRTAESLRNLVLDLSWWDERSNQSAAQDFLGLNSILPTARQAGAEFAALLNIMRDSTDQWERLAAAVEIRDRLDDAAGGFENMNSAQRELYEGVNKIIRDITTLQGQSYDWADAIATVKDEVNAIASALAGMAQGAIGNATKQAEIEALRAGKSLSEARREAQGLQDNLEFDAKIDMSSNPIEAAMYRAQKALAETGRELDAELDAEQEAYRERERLAARAERASSRTAKRGRTDAERAAEQEYNGLLRERDRILNDIMTPMERYQAAVAKIVELGQTPDRANGGFLLSQEEVEAARKRLEELRPEAVAGRDAMNDLFGSILEGSDAAAQALSDLLMQIAKVQFAKGALGLLGMTSGGSWLIDAIGSGLTANANGGVYSGPGISAYSGQVVSKPTLFPFAKGTGLMGEAGPEAILPLVRAANGKLGVQSQGGGSGSGSANITIDVTGARGNAEIQEMVAAGVTQGLSAYDKALPGRVTQINNNPRKR